MFRGILAFFDKIGVYDVVLPFLLVFAIVYAILDKTRVLGTDKIGNEQIPKKNLNAIIAFVMAFLVIASGKLVQAITKISSNVVILLLGSVFFLLLVGSFMKEGEGVFLEKGWNTMFMVIMFVGLVIIFLNAFETSSGQTWWEFIWGYLVNNWSSTAVASLVLLVILIGGVAYVTRSPAKEEKK